MESLLFNIRKYKKQFFTLFLIAVIVISFSPIFFIRNILASSITVNDSTGADTDNGLCSIVEAIINANNDDQSGSVDCTAGSGVDTIYLSNNVNLSSNFNNGIGETTTGTPFISKSLIIDGNGYEISNTSGGIMRLFSIINSPAEDIDLTFSDITLSGGDVVTDGNGGAIRAVEVNSLTISDVIFENNEANNGGAIYITDPLNAFNTTLTIEDSTFDTNISSVNGGAIYSSRMYNFTIDNTDFIANNASSISSKGGAIYYLLGTNPLVINDSYFTQNLTSNILDGNGGDGGVLYNDQSDVEVYNSYFLNNNNLTLNGGVFHVNHGLSNASLTIDSSTFEGNVGVAGGVFYLADGVTLDITNSTFYNNDSLDDGGVIYSYQSLGSPNNISVRYSTAQESFSASTAGAFFFNCVDTGSGCTTSSFGSTQYVFENSILDGCDGDLSDAVFTNILDDVTCGAPNDVTNLDILPENNGGDVKTHKLLSGSNAINAGVSGTLGCPSVDARGRARPVSSACDIGAFEYSAPGITISESSGSTSVLEENQTSDTFTIYLDSYPSNDVSINIIYNDQQLIVSPESVNFSVSGWPETKTVTITAKDDTGDEEDIHYSSISFSVNSADVDYSNFGISNLSIAITDNDTSSSTSTSPSNPPPPPPVSGCTDSNASNFNPNAEVDNGSCVYPPVVVLGCTDSLATNYNSLATDDNGSCIYEVTPILGCTDSNALNFNQEATDDNGSCTYEELPPIEEEDTPEVPQENEVNTRPETNQAGENIQNLLPKEIAGVISNTLNEIPKETKEIVSLAGVTLPAIAFAVTQPGILANLLSVPIRLWNLLPIWLGFRRKRRPWGTVYDSITKQPLDPVYVTLINTKGEEVLTTITDLDGRFGFLVPPGRYKIKVKKDGYEFPTQKLKDKKEDELYGDIYQGQEVEITEDENLVIKNIPMDPVNFNWNEFEKSQNKKLMKFYSKRDLFLARIANIAFYAGLASSLALLFTGSNTLNYILLGVYSLVFILRLLGVKPKKPGTVVEKENGYPLSYGLVRVFSSSLNKEIAHTIISKTGKYYVLVPNGNYYLKIQRKTGEDSYEDVYISSSFESKKGYVGESFKV